MLGCVTGLVAEMLLVRLNSVPAANTWTGTQSGLGQLIFVTRDMHRPSDISQQALHAKPIVGALTTAMSAAASHGV